MERENLEIVQGLYAAFGRGDIPAILEGLADDVDWRQPGSAGVLPFAGVRHGKGEVLSFFQSLDQSLNIELFEPREWMAHVDKVIVLGQEEGTVKATGRGYAFDWAHVFTLRGGRVVQFRDYYDTNVLVEAFRAQ